MWNLLYSNTELYSLFISGIWNYLNSQHISLFLYTGCFWHLCTSMPSTLAVSNSSFFKHWSCNLSLKPFCTTSQNSGPDYILALFGITAVIVQSFYFTLNSMLYSFPLLHLIQFLHECVQSIIDWINANQFLCIPESINL